MRIASFHSVVGQISLRIPPKFTNINGGGGFLMKLFNPPFLGNSNIRTPIAKKWWIRVGVRYKNGHRLLIERSEIIGSFTHW